MPNLKDIDAVILCGGKGQRLRGVVEAPKVLAEINGVPFIKILLEYIKQSGFSRVVMCTGYRAEEVESYAVNCGVELEYVFSREDKPLGTGGAISLAKDKIQSQAFFVVNGDSICDFSLGDMYREFIEKKALASIAVSEVEDPTDYGTIGLVEEDRIFQFLEKTSAKKSKLVNAGVYCFDKAVFDYLPQVESFSIETDGFPELLEQKFYAFRTGVSFLDIGTPERFSRAQDELQ